MWPNDLQNYPGYVRFCHFREREYSIHRGGSTKQRTVSTHSSKVLDPLDRERNGSLEFGVFFSTFT